MWKKTEIRAKKAWDSFRQTATTKSMLCSKLSCAWNQQSFSSCKHTGCARCGWWKFRAAVWREAMGPLFCLGQESRVERVSSFDWCWCCYEWEHTWTRMFVVIYAKDFRKEYKSSKIWWSPFLQQTFGNGWSTCKGKSLQKVQRKTSSLTNTKKIVHIFRPIRLCSQQHYSVAPPT